MARLQAEIEALQKQTEVQREALEEAERQQQRQQQQQRRRFGRAAVASGQYLVVLNAGGQEYKVTLNIQQDPEQSAPVVSEEEWEWLKYVEGLEEEVESDR